MELCTQSLRTWLYDRNQRNPHFQQNPSDLIDAKVKFHQIISGLEYIHDRDIIHRDLKPANILTSKEGVLKIADFGISKDTPDEMHTKQTGTNLYRPYEQRGSVYGTEVDIYAAGKLKLT